VAPVRGWTASAAITAPRRPEARLPGAPSIDLSSEVTAIRRNARGACVGYWDRLARKSAVIEALVVGEGFAVDASLIKADANRQRGVP
jgi:hypothetical protein